MTVCADVGLVVDVVVVVVVVDAAAAAEAGPFACADGDSSAPDAG